MYRFCRSFFISLAVASAGLAAFSQQFKTSFFPIDALHPAIQVDLNNDGIPDTITETHSFQVQELLSSGGQFVSKTIANPASGGYPIASGDFNGDGKADVIFAAPLGIAYGNGAGGFSSAKPISWSNNASYALAQVADFNGDGRPDLALGFDTTQGTQSFQVVIFLNNGNGFNDGVAVYDHQVPSGGNIGGQYVPDLDFVMGDFDADGHADFVLRSTETDPNNPASPITTVTALFGTGTGAFTAETVTTSMNLFQISSADMNNDGNSDVVALYSPISIYYGSHNRTFTTATTPAANVTSGAPILADIDGDGRKDIVYPSLNGNATNNIGVSTLLQISAGVFKQQAMFPVDTYNPGAGEVPFAQSFVSDYNRNGKPDLMLISTGNHVQHPNSADVLFNPDTKPNGTCQVPAPTGIAACSPASGASVASPVSFAFSANSFYPMRKMELWVDGTKRSETYEVFANQGFANLSLSLAAGTHQVSLFSGAFDGSVQKKSYSITVK